MTSQLTQGRGRGMGSQAVLGTPDQAAASQVVRRAPLTDKLY